MTEDYIKRAQAEIVLRRAHIEPYYLKEALDELNSIPKELPSVVRCEECKYCRKEDEFEYWCYGFCSPARLVRKDDFCSHGRKNE